MQTKGVRWPMWRWTLRNSGPLDKVTFDFLASRACCLTGEHHRLHLLATGLMLGTHGTLELWGLWWNIWHTLHWNALEKIRTIIWGTWESNPGPSICQPRPQPLSHCIVFVNIITNKNNIWKVHAMLGTQKACAMFECSTSIWPAHHLLHLPAIILNR